MTISNNIIARLLILSTVLFLGFLLSIIFYSNQASAQFYPAEIREVNSTLSGDQNSLTIYVRGYGACLDSLDPDNFCARSEYVDISVNLDVQRIVNNAHAGDQWEGLLNYPEETTNWWFPGFPTPEQINPAGFSGVVNTSSWPSGTYRFCATVGGSTTALWPIDAYGTDSRCHSPFTIVRPQYTGLVCSIAQSVIIGQSASYIISAEGDPVSSVSVTMASNPAGPVMNNSPLILNSGNSYTGVAEVNTSSLSTGVYDLTFTGTDGVNTFNCVSELTVIDSGTVTLFFDGSTGPTTPTPPDGDSGTLSWNTTGPIDFCTPSMAQGDVNDWSGQADLPGSGSSVVTKLAPGETYIFQIDCVTLGGSPVDPATVQVEVGIPQIPTANLLCLGSDSKTPSTGPCEVGYNSAATLFWSSTYASTCNITPGTWPTTTSGNGNTPNLTSSVSYSLTCSGPGGVSAPSTVQVNVVANQNYTFALSSYNDVVAQGNVSSTNLLVLNPLDGFSSPVAMSVINIAPAGLPLANVNISNAPVNSPYSTPAVAQITTTGVTPGQYTITFQSNGSTSNDPKTLNYVLSITSAIAPTAPQSADVNQGVCGQVIVTWDSHATHNSSIEYRVYRRLSGAGAWGDAIAVIPYTSAGGYTYQDNNIPAGSYEYRISASVGSTGSPSYSPVLGPIVPTPCNASLSGTYKRIVGTGSAPSAYAACGSSLGIELPNGLIYKAGDSVFFEICVRSSGTLALSNVVITEDLVKSLNIENIQLISSSGNCVSGSGSAPSSVNISGNPPGVMNPGQTCSLLLSAVITNPGGPASTLHRFTNYATVGSTQVSTDVNTLPELFSVGGGVPNRTETAP